MGCVRPSSSLPASDIGERRKYMVAVRILNSVVSPKLRNERFKRSKSAIPKAVPKPIIGPISGDISIAPIITAVLLTFSPSEATNIAQISIHSLVPRNTTSSRMESNTASSSSLSRLKSKSRDKYSFHCFQRTASFTAMGCSLPATGSSARTSLSATSSSSSVVETCTGGSLRLSFSSAIFLYFLFYSL